jgi:hypothetical protein
MIELPDFKKAFEYENNFYLSSNPNRISKIIAHYELYKLTENIPGTIVECGIFKGASLVRFASFRDLFGNIFSKKIIGFDIFDKFPETNFALDVNARQNFIDNAGEESISKEQLLHVLQHKNLERNIELIEGDITKTIPRYLEEHPELKISLLNLDTDIYEPAVVILEHLFPRITRGGIIILDDYGVFPGETRAVDEYFADRKVSIEKFPFCMTPCYIVKE